MEATGGRKDGRRWLHALYLLYALNVLRALQYLRLMHFLFDTGKGKGGKRGRSKEPGEAGTADGGSAVRARLSEELTTYLRR